MVAPKWEYLKLSPGVIFPELIGTKISELDLRTI